MGPQLVLLCEIQVVSAINHADLLPLILRTDLQEFEMYTAALAVPPQLQSRWQIEIQYFS